MAYEYKGNKIKNFIRHLMNDYSADLQIESHKLNTAVKNSGYEDKRSECVRDLVKLGILDNKENIQKGVCARNQSDGIAHPERYKEPSKQVFKDFCKDAEKAIDAVTKGFSVDVQ